MRYIFVKTVSTKFLSDKNKYIYIYKEDFYFIIYSIKIKNES